jgi:hypothetical protein
VNNKGYFGYVQRIICRNIRLYLGSFGCFRIVTSVNERDLVSWCGDKYKKGKYMK